MGMKKTDLIKKILFWIAVAFMAFWMIFPFYWMVNSALKSEAVQMTPATFIPRDPYTGLFRVFFANFRAVFQNDKFIIGIRNSVIVAGLTTLISLVVGSFAALPSEIALSRQNTGNVRDSGHDNVSANQRVVRPICPDELVKHSGDSVYDYVLYDAIPFTVWVQTSFLRVCQLPFYNQPMWMAQRRSRRST